ncbi:hypothetical protein Y032_0314g2229 [Ancylostoma ceylanicum]|uniref:Uncharacterized protein n=1 Tax=Ancylostoma ceylanicum TaxID=53326 RepID=A0A016S1S9_9BILA|nr:hypothetical protein Y032_0314g2229 [Ancylostoma ceylanicum]
MILSIGHAKTRLPTLQPGGQPAQLGAIHLPAPDFGQFDPVENGAFVAFVPVDVPYWDCHDEKVQDMLLSPTYETRRPPAFKFAVDHLHFGRVVRCQ